MSGLPIQHGEGMAPLEVPECRDGVCITCADEAVEVVVVELLDDGLARVDTGAGIEEVSVLFVDAVVGDRILVHAKEAIGTVGADDAHPQRAQGGDA